MNNEDFTLMRNDLKVRINSKIEIKNYLSESFPGIGENVINAITNVMNVNTIDDSLCILGELKRPIGRLNGHMPALLLAPHRILRPAFLGLGVLMIILLSMFAG